MWENTDQKIFKYGRSSRSADSVYFQVNIFDLKNILQGQKANFEKRKAKRKRKEIARKRNGKYVSLNLIYSSYISKDKIHTFPNYMFFTFV